MIDNYEMDEFGVIHQIEFTPIKYDKKYISYYEDLSDRTIKLGYQRLGWRSSEEAARQLETGDSEEAFDAMAKKIAKAPKLSDEEIKELAKLHRKQSSRE